MSESENELIYFADGKMWFTKAESVNDNDVEVTTVTLGVSPDAVEELGAIKSIKLADVGDDCDRGDVLATLRGEDGVLKITAPVAGYVAEINEQAVDDFSLVSDDPTQEGWLVRIEAQDASDLHDYE